MQKFSDPMLARSLLQSQQNSDEALNIKRDADPTFDFIGYLETLPQTSGMYMGNASIIPRNYREIPLSRLSGLHGGKRLPECTQSEKCSGWGCR